ncbi:MAG: hypothetical protein OSA97_11740 [Nevskia sp.]|nr:hypothetical protein [Nevskia sp.]
MAAAMLAAACEGASPQAAALRAGRDAVMPCQERFHEQSQTYADCVRYVTQSAARRGETAQYADWFRLGGLYTGWVHADLVGQQGDAPAAQAARELLREALPLQQQLRSGDAQLCELEGIPCATLLNRRRELLGPATAAGAS